MFLNVSTPRSFYLINDLRSLHFTIFLKYASVASLLSLTFQSEHS